MDDTISRKAAIDAMAELQGRASSKAELKGISKAWNMIKQLPPAQPEQLEQCPIYGGMCAYPSDQCYDCPRHAGAKMEVTT